MFAKNIVRSDMLPSLVLQQYFFEFAFDEIKARPRHVCPFAVVSFQYKGKETVVAPMTAHR